MLPRSPLAGGGGGDPVTNAAADAAASASASAASTAVNNNTNNSTSTDTSTSPAPTTPAVNPTPSADGSSGNALYERLKKCPDVSILSQSAIPACLVGTYSGTDVLTGVACSSTLAADGTVTHSNGTITTPGVKVKTDIFSKSSNAGGRAIALNFLASEPRDTVGYEVAFDLSVGEVARGSTLSNPYVDVTQEYSVNGNKQVEATCRVPLR